MLRAAGAVEADRGRGFRDGFLVGRQHDVVDARALQVDRRSEEHPSELQSLMRTSYAVFCLNKTKINTSNIISIPIMSFQSQIYHSQILTHMITYHFLLYH